MTSRNNYSIINIHTIRKESIHLNNEEKILTILEQHTALLETMQSDIGGLKSDVSTMKSDINTLKSDVKTIKSDVEEINLNVKFLWEDIDRGDSRLKSHVETMHKFVR